MKLEPIRSMVLVKDLKVGDYIIPITHSYQVMQIDEETINVLDVYLQYDLVLYKYQIMDDEGCVDKISMSQFSDLKVGDIFDFPYQPPMVKLSARHAIHIHSRVDNKPTKIDPSIMCRCYHVTDY